MRISGLDHVGAKARFRLLRPPHSPQLEVILCPPPAEFSKRISVILPRPKSDEYKQVVAADGTVQNIEVIDTVAYTEKSMRWHAMRKLPFVFYGLAQDPDSGFDSVSKDEMDDAIFGKGWDLDPASRTKNLDQFCCALDEERIAAGLSDGDIEQLYLAVLHTDNQLDERLHEGIEQDFLPLLPPADKALAEDGGSTNEQAVSLAIYSGEQPSDSI